MKKIINEGEVGVLRRKGIVIKTLPAGQQRYSRILRGERLIRVDTRPVEYQTDNLEYITADKLAVRIGIVVICSIKSPIDLVKRSNEDAASELINSSLERSARSIIAKYTLEELLEKTKEIEKTLNELASSQLQPYGISIDDVAPVNVLLPRNLKNAYEAKLVAKKRAEADLEEARGRTATLRHLANAADIVEKRPILMQLLLGQKAKQAQFQYGTEREQKSK